MTNIVGILEEADDRTLILLDELGAGTDPVEGAALAAAIIESARGMGAAVAATTPVSYTHLDVYKRQREGSWLRKKARRAGGLLRRGDGVPALPEMRPG